MANWNLAVTKDGKTKLFKKTPGEINKKPDEEQKTVIVHILRREQDLLTNFNEYCGQKDISIQDNILWSYGYARSRLNLIDGKAVYKPGELTTNDKMCQVCLTRFTIDCFNELKWKALFQ